MSRVWSPGHSWRVPGGFLEGCGAQAAPGGFLEGSWRVVEPRPLPGAHMASSAPLERSPCSSKRRRTLLLSASARRYGWFRRSAGSQRGQHGHTDTQHSSTDSHRPAGSQSKQLVEHGRGGDGRTDVPELQPQRQGNTGGITGMELGDQGIPFRMDPRHCSAWQGPLRSKRGVL